MTTAAALARAYATGKKTPRDVAERFLAAAADKREPPLAAFLAIDAADVRRQADESTRRLATGRPRSPLEGVLVAVKDGYDLRGYPTRAGTRLLGQRPATDDAPAVARLRAAGAILAGKTNMFELGVLSSGLNVHHGIVRNPHDPSRDTGGSSSGSAAAVAAGLVPIALGSDSGGSVRIPAALCGTAGLKGTAGRVPTDGLVPLTWSLDHAGLLGASVEDVRLAFEIMAAASVPPEDVPLRVGICDAWWAGADPAVAAAVERALRDAGADLVRVDLPHIDLSVAAGGCILLSEAASAHADLLDGDGLQPSTRGALEIGRGFLATEFLKAQQLRTQLRDELDRALAGCQALATPTTAIVAPPYREDALTTGETDEARLNALIHFTFAANLTGHPAASVPCGAVDGLPVGLQLLTAHGSDGRALSLAARIERTAPRLTPRVNYDLLGG